MPAVDLVPTAELDAVDAELTTAERDDLQANLAVDASSPAFGRALRFYWLLTHRSERFLAEEASGGHALRIFQSRYLWFSVFARQHREAVGENAGIEQQLFQLLETAPPGFNWDAAEVLEAIATRLASRSDKSSISGGPSAR